MQMSQSFEDRLLPVLPDIISHFGSPFHIVDEAGIIDTALHLDRTMRVADERYRNFYAVKANSPLELLKLLFSLGMGFDCSSPVELVLARGVGAKPEDIFFSSNHTARETFEVALADGGCIMNLDDIELIDDVGLPFPGIVCFRLNPGPERVLDSVIGNPADCKYGVPIEQIVDAYRKAMERGATRFALHTMVVSNERLWQCHAETTRINLGVAGMLEDELGIRVEMANNGGGFGIPYLPVEEPLDIESYADAAKQALDAFREQRGWSPQLCTENGRYILGPHGVFVAECISEKHGYVETRGLNASAMSTVMRPTMYHSDDNPFGGYHHISVLEEPTDEPVLCQVVGPACEDSGRYGWDRLLSLHKGQHAIVHNTGAHAPEMGSNYNNWPKAQMLILRTDGRVDIITPAETTEELVARRLKYLEEQYTSQSFTPRPLTQ